jgi:hypothetical protein
MSGYQLINPGHVRDNQLCLGKFYRGKTLKYTMYIKSLANIQDNYHDIVDFVSASGTSFNDETLLSHSLTGQLIF